MSTTATVPVGIWFVQQTLRGEQALLIMLWSNWPTVPLQTKHDPLEKLFFEQGISCYSTNLIREKMKVLNGSWNWTWDNTHSTAPHGKKILQIKSGIVSNFWFVASVQPPLFCSLGMNCWLLHHTADFAYSTPMMCGLHPRGSTSFESSCDQIGQLCPLQTKMHPTFKTIMYGIPCNLLSLCKGGNS